MTVNRRSTDVTLTRATLLRAVLEKAREVRREEEEQAAMDDTEALMPLAAGTPAKELEELMTSTEPFIGTPLTSRSLVRRLTHAPLDHADELPESVSLHYKTFAGDVLDGAESTASSTRMPSPQKRRLLSVTSESANAGYTSLLGQPIPKYVDCHTLQKKNNSRLYA